MVWKSLKKTMTNARKRKKAEAAALLAQLKNKDVQHLEQHKNLAALQASNKINAKHKKKPANAGFFLCFKLSKSACMLLGIFQEFFYA